MIFEQRTTDFLGRSPAPTVRLALLLLAAVCIAGRDPLLVTSPRFWAEEMTVYFAAALGDGGTVEVLTAAHLGYFSLVANFAGWLAATLPLERAPWGTLAVSFAVQLIPFAIIAFGRAPIFGATGRKLLAGAVLLVFGAAGELFLNAVNSQAHLAVTVALIYLELTQAQGPGRRAALAGVAALAALSSPQACFATPAFWLRWWRRRARADLWVAVMLSGGCLVQAAAVLLGGEGHSEGRFHFREDAGEWVQGVVEAVMRYPVFGRYSDNHGWMVLLIVIAGSVAFAALQIRVLRRGPRRDWLLLAWGVSLLSIFASLGMSGGDRYMMFGSILLGLLLMAVALDQDVPRFWRRIAGGLLAAGLLLQAVDWQARVAAFNQPDWTRWSEEVRNWHAGESDRLRAHPQWPGSDWTLTLPRAAQ